jgi:hypothetical protein
MKILLGLLIGSCVFSWAQEEVDPVDRLACLDESQRSQPISETARCNAEGELYDPYKGFNTPYKYPPGDFTEADRAAMQQRYDEAYAKLSPFQRQQVADGRLIFNWVEFILVTSSDRHNIPESSTAK